MRILYIGNFRHQICTEVQITRTLIDMGHRVIPMQEDQTTPSRIEASLRKDRIDLVLYTRTWGLGQRVQDAWEWAAAHDTPTAAVHLDLWFGLRREHQVHTDPMFKMAHVFTADGGHDAEFAAAGVNHHWLPPAMYRPSVGRGEPRDEWRCDVLFAGSHDSYHDEWPHRQHLIQFLREQYGERCMLIGPRSGRKFVPEPEMNDLYASAKVVVGDSLMLGPRYWSNRVPETVGRGGVLLHPYEPNLEEQMAGCVHFYRLGDFDHLARSIDLLLEDDDQREQTRHWGPIVVEGQHTFHQRMAHVLHEVGL